MVVFWGFLLLEILEIISLWIVVSRWKEPNLLELSFKKKFEFPSDILLFCFIWLKASSLILLFFLNNSISCFNFFFFWFIFEIYSFSLFFILINFLNLSPNILSFSFSFFILSKIVSTPLFLVILFFLVINSNFTNLLGNLNFLNFWFVYWGDNNNKFLFLFLLTAKWVLNCSSFLFLGKTKKYTSFRYVFIIYFFIL